MLRTTELILNKHFQVVAGMGRWKSEVFDTHPLADGSMWLLYSDFSM